MCIRDSSLDEIGCNRFHAHLALIPKEAIMSLKKAPYNDANGTLVKDELLPLMKRIGLCIVSSLFHAVSRKYGKIIDIRRMSPQMFDAYRVNKYNPDLPILQWNAKSTELVSWTKNLRFSSKDYPKFNDEAYFQKYLEKFLTALQSHGMQDVLDDKVNYTDPTLFHAHSTWLYKLWQDTWLASGAKVLLAQHLQDKDVRTIWKEFNLSLIHI